MKKLVIALAAVAVAAVTEAATVKWQSGTVTDAGMEGATGTAYAGATFYFYEITAKQYSDFGNDMAAVYAAKGSLGTSIADGTTKANGKANITTGAGTSWATSSTHYLAVISEEEIGDTTYYIANTIETTVGSGDNTTTINNYATNLHGGSGSAISWTAVAVPEPTSGLLLLLGMAGIALRRRRA